jgi:hypothetical protein
MFNEVVIAYHNLKSLLAQILFNELGRYQVTLFLDFAGFAPPCDRPWFND